MAQQIPLEDFTKHFSSLTELQSDALGGHILSCSDEFFASASDLLKTGPAVSLKGQFGPNGALYDGWETRRHNPDKDWVIIKLGATGTLTGLDIDTSNFNGNEAPAASVQGLYLPEDDAAAAVPGPDAPQWQTLLEPSPLGPTSRHLFLFHKPTPPLSHLKLCMHPDGGIARFRAYGHIQLMPPALGTEAAAAPLDLAHVLNGGRVVKVSDQHFGQGPNLILPGRGKDMGDGWETKRSRRPGHNDWVIIKLGEPGYLEWTEIDTLHFVGNFPNTCELYGAHSEFDTPGEATKWSIILPRTKLGPHKQHFFSLNALEDAKPITHVKLVIYPDGGVKRVRLIGRRASAAAKSQPLSPIANPDPNLKDLPSVPGQQQQQQQQHTSVGASATATETSIPSSHGLPLAKENFAPYGSVIETVARSTPAAPHEDDERSLKTSTREGGVHVKTVNFGTARKYNFLAPLLWTGQEQKHQAQLNVCIFRCDRQASPTGSRLWPVEALERHKYSSQAFVPMGGCQSGRYLVIVALPGVDGQPDPATVKGFLAGPHQGICYKPGIWHHPLIALAEGQTDAMEFQCMVYETGVAEVDCDLVEFASPIASVSL